MINITPDLVIIKMFFDKFVSTKFHLVRPRLAYCCGMHHVLEAILQWLVWERAFAQCNLNSLVSNKAEIQLVFPPYVPLR